MYSSSWNDFTNAANTNYKVIRLTKDITSSGGYINNKNTIFDFGGYTISKTTDYAGAIVRGAAGIVNGTFYKEGSHQAFNIYYVDFIEDLNIIVGSALAKNATAMLISSNATYGSYVGSIKNVTIDSVRDANGNHIDGIGIYNHGIEIPNSNTVIGSMENVEIYSKGQAILTQATIGTMTDCVFSGEKIALVIQRLQGEFKLVNCTVDGGTLAIELSGVIASKENPASFVFDSTTTFETSGIIFNASAIENAENCDISSIAGTVALVNGKLYTSIEDAVAALKASTEEVTNFALMQNLEITEAIVIDKKVNFSLGGGTFEIPKYGYSYGTVVTVPGYTISSPNDENGDGVFHVVKGGVLTLSGDGTVNSVGNNIYNIAVWADGGEVIINGGTYTNVSEGLTSDHYDLIYVKNGGSVVINGGTFIAQTPKWTLNLHDSTEGSIVVNAGTFYGYNPAASETEPGGVCSFAADGTCIILKDGNYIVAESHTWIDATCTEAKNCSVCGTTEGEALGHSMSGWTLTTAPVYGKAGEETNKCANCDYAETRAYNAEAKIGDVYYATFAEAYDAKEAGTTIVLLAPITVTSDMTLNIDGITIESAGDVFVVTSGTLIVEGNGVVNAGKAGVGSWCAVWANGGTVVINGGTYSVGGDSSSDPLHQNDLIYTKNGGKVTINGGTFIAGEGIWALNENDANRGTITVKGGNFVGFNPANNVSEGEGTNFVADGYHAQKSDNVYTVAPHSFVLNDIVYKNGFENAGVKINTCTGCGATYEEATEAIFKNLGLSASEFEVGGITIGYKVNTEFLEEYEAVTGNEITYGVFAVLADKIGNGDILDEKGTPAAGVINKEIKSYGINEFNFKLVGFTTEKLMSAKIVMGAYVFERTQEGVNVSYIQPNVPQEGERYYAVSYNGLTGKED